MISFFTTKTLRSLRITKAFFVQLSVLSTLVVNYTQAQTTSTPPQKDVPEHKKIIVINNNKFAVYNNWVTIGSGLAHNFNFPWSNGQFNGGIDLNFHLNVYYFQFGVAVAGDRYGYYNFLQAHLAYGLRKETAKYNLACFGGFSYSDNFLKKADGSGYLLDAKEAYGLYAQVQAIKKITYDIGIGLSAFAELNKYQSLIGIRLDAYFSLGYKGKANPYLNQ